MSKDNLYQCWICGDTTAISIDVCCSNCCKPHIGIDFTKPEPFIANPLVVDTKYVKGEWFSFTTFKGYDHSENGSTLEEAQYKIIQTLIQHGYNAETVEFSEPKVYYDKKQSAYDPTVIIRYCNSRIDNNPHG